jgi:hypothetical protein
MVADDGGSSPGQNGGATPMIEMLLSSERAAVTVAVALACGASTGPERAELQHIGSELVLLCCALRERFDLAGLTPPPYSSASAAVAPLLATQSHDARLAGLADYLNATGAEATTALASVSGDTTQGELVRTLRDLISAHARAAEWLHVRAAAFAATRPSDALVGDNTFAPGPEQRPLHAGEPAPGEPRPDGDTER